MRRNKRLHLIDSCWLCFAIGMVSLLLQGCSANKYLEDGEKFYGGAVVKVKLRDTQTSEEQTVAKNSAEDQLSPEPNDVILGSRPSVWLYMRVDSTDKVRVVSQWLKRKFGREAVLYDPKIPKRTVSAIENKLFNNGFFNAHVEYKVKESKNAVDLRYRVYPGKRYYMDSIFVQKGEDSIFNYIAKHNDKSLIQAGDPYELDVLKEERVRISNEVKNQGFYYFNDDYIGFKVDTTRGNEKLAVGLTLKNSAPQKSKIPFVISEVNVYPNFELGGDTSKTNHQVITIDSINFVDTQGFFDYHFLAKAIFLKKGEKYTSKFHDLTIRRLSSLEVFKFIDVRFIHSDSTENGLIVNVYLTPLLPQSVRLEVGAASKSNNFVGPGVDVNYAHKNLLKGAEHLSVGIGGAFETQFGKNSQGVNSTELSFSSKLSLPRLWSPIHFPIATYKELPKTEIGFNYTLLDRTRFYQLHNATTDFGYRWDQSVQKHHKFTLVSLNYTRASEISSTFQDFLDENPELNRTFSEQLIFGSYYSYRYYSKPPSTKRYYWYVNPAVEIAGNSLNAFGSVLNLNSDGQRKVLGIGFSQFAKVDLDLRFYLPLGKDRKVVWRFLGGFGAAYGNSTALPYLKQYFIGGSNSIRAFQARSLGPGTYESKQRNGLLIDQSGDIKLESSVEYRTGIYRFIKGAVFLDAGNIWLLRKDEVRRPGGEFLPNKFLNQLAIGTGAGLRFDFTYFILRADLAFPLRNPTLVTGNRWLIDDITFSKKWRQDNLVLNIAIGYPF